MQRTLRAKFSENVSQNVTIIKSCFCKSF